VSSPDRPVPATARRLGLDPHPEGGWFRRTWQAAVRIPAAVLPDGYSGDRPVATSICYLLAPGERSRWHQVRSAELWLWQGGGSLWLTTGGFGASPQAESSVLLGPHLEDGAVVQHVVEAGQWQCAEPADATEVLVACVVAPGFAWEDFRLGE
jgi:predicted cupin superfamily sugar epimerase